MRVDPVKQLKTLQNMELMLIQKKIKLDKMMENKELGMII